MNLLSVLKGWISGFVTLEYGNLTKVLLHCEASWVDYQPVFLRWYTLISMLTSSNCNNSCFQYCSYQTRLYLFSYLHSPSSPWGQGWYFADLITCHLAVFNTPHINGFYTKEVNNGLEQSIRQVSRSDKVASLLLKCNLA